MKTIRKAVAAIGWRFGAKPQGRCNGALDIGRQVLDCVFERDFTGRELKFHLVDPSHIGFAVNPEWETARHEAG